MWNSIETDEVGGFSRKIYQSDSQEREPKSITMEEMKKLLKDTL